MQQFWQQVVTGQAKSITLLAVAMVLFAYFLPAVIAFTRAHRRFFVILLLNILVSPVQSLLLARLAPSFVAVDPSNPLSGVTLALIANFGLGWIALMIWALVPGEPDPRLQRARQTKYYDAVVALPLILWFVYGVMTLRPVLAADAHQIAAGIRAKRSGEDPRKLEPIIDEGLKGVDIFITLNAGAYILTNGEKADAMELAEKKLVELLSAYLYEQPS